VLSALCGFGFEGFWCFEGLDLRAFRVLWFFVVVLFGFFFWLF
jgi:hypothetical protein